ncbi:hypothetical protein EDB85DRAFT_1945428, partial [Lactarius pseudohatsudake]
MFLARRSLGIAYTAPLTRRLSSRASSVLGALDIPTTPTEATRRLRWGVEGLWRHTSERLSYNWGRSWRTQASPAELHAALERTREAYVHFRSIPAPRRGEI